MAGGYTEVFAAKGPYAGRRLMLPDDQVGAATAQDGWAVAWEPGNVVIADPNAPIDPAWVLPGWNAYPAIVPPPLPPDTNPPEPEPVAPVAVMSLWNTDPARVLVATSDIGKFANGDVVTMAGVPVPYGFVNGAQTIANVGVVANQFELVGVDLSVAPSTIADAGMTVTPPAPPARTTVAYSKNTVAVKR